MREIVLLTMDIKIIAIAIIAVAAIGGGAAAFTLTNNNGDTEEIIAIEYVLNGGENNSKNPSTFTSETINLENPSRECYSFDGWYMDKEFTTSVSSLNKGDGKVTVYAKWTPITYTISYVLNGENVSNDNPISGTADDQFTLKDLSSTGMTFGGWFTSNSLSDNTKVTVLTPRSDVTLYAKWTPIQYSINYVLAKDNATTTNPTSGTIKDLINLTDAECPGYHFEGWFTSGTFDENTKITYFTPDSDKIIYAKWSLVTNNIVYVDAIEPLNRNPVQGTVEDEIVLVDAIWPARQFDGWFTSSTFESNTKVTTISPATDTTLYAKWITLEGHELVYGVAAKISDDVIAEGVMGMVLADIREIGYLSAQSVVISVPINLGSVKSASYDSKWNDESDDDYSDYEFLRIETIETEFGEKETYVIRDGETTAWVGKDGIPYKIVSDKMAAILATYSEAEIEETVTITIVCGTGVSVTGAGTYKLGDHVTLTATMAEGVVFKGYASGSYVVHTAPVWELDVTESMIILALPIGQYGLYESGATGVQWTVIDDQTGLTVAAPTTNPAIVTLPDNKCYTVKMLGTVDGQLVANNEDLTTGYTFVNVYTWKYKYGILSSLSGNMQWTGYTSDYTYFKHLNTDQRHYIDDATTSSFVRANDSVIVSIKDYLNDEASSLTEIQKANYVLQFVQEAIPYVTDAQGKGMDEYWKYPYETLYDMCGDCEDKSILYASIMKAMGYDVALVILPGHMGVGLAGVEGSTGTYIEVDGKQYYYCETTNTTYTVGVWPEGMETEYEDIIPIA